MTRKAKKSLAGRHCLIQPPDCSRNERHGTGADLSFSIGFNWLVFERLLLLREWKIL